MSSLLNELHFWTTQEDVVTKHSYYGAFKYHSRKESTEWDTKKDYCEKRSVIWNSTNKRHNKLKDRLKELEDVLIQNKIIDYRWNEDILQLLLSTGLIVFLKVNVATGDVVNISFDKQLSAKLQVNIICDGIILGPQVVCICNDGHVLGYGGVWKDGWLLEGGPRRKVHSHGDWLVVWGRPGSENPQPWSPLTKDHQRANLHLYWLGLRGPKLLAYKNTDGEPFIVVVSKIFEQTLILVEQKVTQRGAVSLEVSTLELSGSTLKVVEITAVPLQTHVSCCRLSPAEDYLLICCIDSTLAILDRNRGTTKTIKAAFIPTLCVWHKTNALVAVCTELGQLQYYDVALNCLKSQIVSEDDTANNILDLSTYFHSQVSVVSLNWDYTHLVVALEQGPLICVTHVPKSLSFVALARKYLDLSEVKKAIALLLSWSFGEDAYFILQKIVSYLLKLPMTEQVAQQLQDALGCYHASPVPLSAEIRNQYGNRIMSMTRRYFHQLVRAGMYETAFLLAVDVVHHDLFMDLHFIAVKIGETEMAAAAKAQASALMSRCSSAASDSSSISNRSDSSKSEERDKAKLPDSVNDNLQSTNFNQPDIPKLNPPRVNYVKPPQVPTTFTSKPIATVVPPLPFTLPQPIPYYTPYNHYESTSFQTTQLAKASRQTNYVRTLQSMSRNPGTTIYPNSNRNVPQKLVPFVKRTMPPLPVINSNIDTDVLSKLEQAIPPFASSDSVINPKKAQTKVKFSDTVTAFIVPEIKRPVRPPPPPHITDPRKELADSLPLCHPNEDYLKDFAPVRENEERKSAPIFF